MLQTIEGNIYINLTSIMICLKLYFKISLSHFTKFLGFSFHPTMDFTSKYYSWFECHISLFLLYLFQIYKWVFYYHTQWAAVKTVSVATKDPEQKGSVAPIVMSPTWNGWFVASNPFKIWGVISAQPKNDDFKNLVESFKENKSITIIFNIQRVLC